MITPLIKIIIPIHCLRDGTSTNDTIPIIATTTAVEFNNKLNVIASKYLRVRNCPLWFIA